MDAERAKGIIAGFKGKRILVIGDVMLDRYVLGTVERLNPEAPVPILHATGEKYATGGAGNTAKNVAALGGQAVLVGVVGKDTIAERVEAAAKEEGYTASVVKDSARPTTEKIRYVVNNQQMLRVDYEERKDVSGDIEQDLIASIEKAVEGVQAIIVSDYAKGTVTEAVAKTIMQTLQPHSAKATRGRQAQIPIMADVKPSRVNWFTGATWLSPNRKEGFEFLGIDQFDSGGMSDEELAEKLQDKFGATIFLTLSANGIFVLGEAERAHVPQEHEIEVADTSGAGDTAAVAIVLAKLSGATDVEAAQLANAAGAIVASTVGAVGVTPDELLNMVAHKHA